MFRNRNTKPLTRCDGSNSSSSSSSSSSSGTASVPQGCIEVAEVVLVRLAAGDTLEVKEYVTGEGGALYGLRLCMAASPYKDLPAGLESLMVTHR
jgi:hypothetical protein